MGVARFHVCSSMVHVYGDNTAAFHLRRMQFHVLNLVPGKTLGIVPTWFQTPLLPCRHKFKLVGAFHHGIRNSFSLASPTECRRCCSNSFRHDSTCLYGGESLERVLVNTLRPYRTEPSVSTHWAKLLHRLVVPDTLAIA